MSVNEAGTEPGLLRAEFERLREELASIRTLLTSGAAEHLSGAKAAAESRLAALQTEVEKLTEDVKGRSAEALQTMNRTVQERPLTSIAVAFGVGLLAAQLLRR